MPPLRLCPNCTPAHFWSSMTCIFTCAVSKWPRSHYNTTCPQFSIYGIMSLRGD
jgi:hypothetical protein